MKDIDEEISKVISAKIYEPEGYKNAIETALYKENIKSPKTYFYKMIAIVCCCLILLSGVAYASYAIIKNVFNNRKGVETAISNNYIMDGLQEYQESNGVAVKINNILMDDYNLDISFNLKFDKEIEIDNDYELQFEKMIILDEENRVLFHTRGKGLLRNFIEKNKLNIKIDDFSEKYVNTGVNAQVRNKTANQFDLVYNITTYENSNPKSKEIIIYAENIILNENTIIEGTWQIKQKMDKKFCNREQIVYHCESEKDENIVNVEALSYATGTNIAIEIKNETNENMKELNDILKNIKNQAKSESEGNSEKNNKFIDAITTKSDELYNIFSDIYVKNSNGTKFFITNNVNANEKMIMQKEDNIVRYFNILDMTIYDCTERLTLHFIYNSKEYNVKLIN